MEIVDITIFCFQKTSFQVSLILSLSLDIRSIVFAFCSILTMWKYDDQALSEEVLLRLFPRLSRSAKHHPEDLPEYREAWDRWKTQIK
ncbi:hypothetical protein [Fictibacillus sp. NRS-1165]|uniref:hypothetical protein n=1 Tax=Fictibacillus sp. NRS-1165 TaxID=3144463 RepID=UPI003D220C31